MRTGYNNVVSDSRSKSFCVLTLQREKKIEDEPKELLSSSNMKSHTGQACSQVCILCSLSGLQMFANQSLS